MRIVNKLKNLNSNNKIILKNISFAFMIRGAALVISFFTTPAFIRYFDNNTVLGVWYTLLSVLLWFLNFDLGIGNGIRNNLVKDFTNKDYESAKRTLSSGLLSIGVVTTILTVVGFFLINLIDLNWLFNIDQKDISDKGLLIATFFVLLGVMLRFFLTSISSVFFALQMSSINNFLSLCVSVLQLIFVLVVKPAHPEQGLIVLSIAYAIISNVPIIIAGLIVFSTKLKMCRPSWKSIDKIHINKVIGIGMIFFVCQILYMLIINTNEFLISYLFGPQCTTEYTFYYKLSSLISMVISLAMTPIWSIVTKAMAEKNYVWLHKLYKIVKLIGMLSIVLQYMFVIVQQFVMDLWLQEESIQINYFTAISFATFGSAFIYSTILSTIVCGMARMRLQAICYSIGIIVKFVVVYFLASITDNWTIVVWSNAIILISYCIIQQIDLDRYIKKLVKKTQKQ